MPSRPAGVAFLADRDISALYRLYFTTSTKKSRRWGWKGGQKTSKRSFIYTEENNEKTGGEDPAFLTAHALAPGGDGDDPPWKHPPLSNEYATSPRGLLHYLPKIELGGSMPLSGTPSKYPL